MDFFRSVFAEEPSPPSSPTSSDQNNNYNSEITPTSPSNSPSQNPNPNPNPNHNPNPNPNPKFPIVANSWTTFGSSFLKSVASKSESVIGNYRRDLEEFSSGFRKETDIIREAASRVVKDLPGRLESGAAVAQTSLESVGQVIDNLGGAVSEIIIHGKDSIFSANDDGDSDSEVVEIGDNSSNKQIVKPYSRLDALIIAVQCDIKTYCEEPEEVGEYVEWKKGFLIEEKIGEIEDLIKENGAIGEIYNEVVPVKVDHGTFWSRYFFRVYRVKTAEEARVKLVKRAIEGEEEEELSWDVDDEEEEDNENNGFKSRGELKGELEDNVKKLENLQLGEMEKELKSGDEKRLSVYEMKSEAGSDVRESVEGRLEEVKSDRGSSVGKNDNISDFSIVSSQRSSHVEEDIGWDEIENIESDDETKVAPRGGPSIANVRKRLSADEEEEELPWDAEDDDEPNKL